MSWRRWARAVGVALALAAAAFLFQRLIALEIWRHTGDFEGFVWVLVTTAVVYAAGVLILAFAWRALLGRTAPPIRQSLAWYLLSQFGKYLPGNVAHLAGRHLLFAGGGVPQSTLLAAATQEAALLAGSGALVAAAFSPPLIGRAFGAMSSTGMVIGSLALLALVVACVWLVKRAAIGRDGRIAAAVALSLHLIFFVVSGGILVGLVQFFGAPGVAAQHWPLIVAACAAAWFCGFVVPGAPGGLGIRESVLVLLLSPVLGGETSLLGALAYRAVTISGDGLAAFSGMAVARWPGKPRPAD